MDTESIVIKESYEKNTDNMHEVCDENGKWLLTYLVMDRALQEICHLFKVFRYNLDKLLSEYELFISDDFVKKNNNR